MGNERLPVKMTVLNHELCDSPGHITSPPQDSSHCLLYVFALFDFGFYFKCCFVLWGKFQGQRVDSGDEKRGGIRMGAVKSTKN